MEIKLEIDNDVIILKLSGNLNAASVEALKEQISKLIGKKYLHVILDMTRIDMIDSTGLGTCMGISREISSKGGLLVCIGLNENVKRVFHLTRIDQKIAVCDTKNDAIDVVMKKIATGNA